MRIEGGDRGVVVVGCAPVNAVPGDQLNRTAPASLVHIALVVIDQDERFARWNVPLHDFDHVPDWADPRLFIPMCSVHRQSALAALALECLAAAVVKGSLDGQPSVESACAEVAAAVLAVGRKRLLDRAPPP